MSKVVGLIEIARSFSYKLNAGNYESRDFFCSAKGQCRLEDDEEVADLLYAFCKKAVLRSIAEYQGNTIVVIPESVKEPETPIPSITVEHSDMNGDLKSVVIPEIGSKEAAQKVGLEQFEKQKQEFDKTPEARGLELKNLVLAAIPGASEKHLREFYLGWFNIDSGKQLPRKSEAFFILLETLLIAAGEMPDEIITQLTTQPRILGGRMHDTFLRAKEVRDIKDGVTTHDIPQDLPPSDIPDTEVFSDPLLDHFHWTDMELAVFARALMVKWGHDIKAFNDHLKFLKMLELSEPDLKYLLRLWYHDASAHTLWRVAQEHSVPIKTAFEKVESQLGASIGMETKSANVTTAITVVIDEIRQIKAAATS